MKKIKFNLYKFIQNLAIMGVFAVVGLLVLGITSAFAFTPAVFDVVTIIGIICLGCTFLLPWVKLIEKQEHKKLSLIFIITTLVCVVMWSISAIFIVAMLNYKTALSLSCFRGFLIYLKIAAFITIQYAISSIVISNFLKYKFTFLPFQIVMYLSNLFVDFYLSYLVFCMYINDSYSLIFINAVNLLTTKTMITLICLTASYVILSNIILALIRKKKLKLLISEEDKKEKLNVDVDVSNIETDSKFESDLEIKLKQLTEAYKKNLITAEQYSKKKQEIIDNF